MLLHLYVGQVQLRAPDALTAIAGALRTLILVLPDHKFVSALQAPVAPGAVLYLQAQSLEIGPFNDSFEAEAKGFLVDPRQFANLESNLAQARVGVARCFGTDRS
jgi:hypothetical protein